MKIKNSCVFLFGIILVFCAGSFAASCASQRNTVFIPVPDDSFFQFEKTIGVNIDDIIQTRSGSGSGNIPEWLRAFLDGGVEAVETLFDYRDKYVFIENNRGENFTALNKWLDFFIVKQDISQLIAARIERKMILSASLYPDDEYGLFFERLIKNAYNAEYPDTKVEDTYWIKIRDDEGDEEDEEDEEIYLFFIFAGMDKTTMQNIIEKMMENTLEEIALSGRRASLRNNQTASINNLRQNFFEGF